MTADMALEFVLIVSGIAGAFITGRRFERRHGIETHKHIWDVWEHCELSDGWHWVRREKVQRFVKGQKRDCLSCGEREVRQVVA